MINIAAHVTDLSPSQKSFYLIKEFNKMLENTELSPSVFHNRGCIPPKHPCFSCRMAAFMPAYNGAVIATSMEEARTIIKLANKSDRYLYVWDLDWLTNPVWYSTAMEILRNDKLKLIARSEQHATLIQNFCNKHVVGIVDNWNSEQLLAIISKEKSNG